MREYAYAYIQEAINSQEGRYTPIVCPSCTNARNLSKKTKLTATGLRQYFNRSSEVPYCDICCYPIGKTAFERYLKEHAQPAIDVNDSDC